MLCSVVSFPTNTLPDPEDVNCQTWLQHQSSKRVMIANLDSDNDDDLQEVFVRDPKS